MTKTLAVLLLLGALSSGCRLSGEKMHKPKRAQAFHGDENVLIIGPAQLLDAVVKVDGQHVGYLWSAEHMLLSWGDHAYSPAMPADIEASATATRIRLGAGHHIIAIELPRYLPVVKELDVSTRQSVLLRVKEGELRHAGQ